MRKIRWSAVVISISLVVVLLFPITDVFASGNHLQNGNVVASAVFVPAQVSRIDFVVSGLVKEIMVKEGDTIQAGQTLVVLDASDLEFNVIAAQEALRSAQANVEVQKYKRVKDRRNGRVFFDVVPPEVRQLAETQAQKAQAALEIAQATLAQYTLVAPYDATVASVDIAPGEFVSQGKIVITLATLDNLQIETTDLIERDITKIKVGDPVNISVEALNENINGEVIGIAPKANTIGGDIVFKVIITPDEQLKGLLWGMTAEVTIGD